MSEPYRVYNHNGEYKGTAGDPGGAVKRPYSGSYGSPSSGGSSGGWGDGIWSGFGKRKCTGSGIFGGSGSSSGGGVRSGVRSGVSGGINGGINGGV
ncbi:hypothetical protein [Pseudocowpox virus]|uniref:Uncharacterized protein n=1 Tax=Pseudocowpox virus TaxID=129726 RepID=D3IZ21_9POXV|nr:hypothetical protein [Pseudocowpox virus]